MSLIRRRKQNAPPIEPTKTRLENQTELFVLATVAGDGNLKEAAARLRAMTSAERRELRKSIQRLDYLLDDVSLESMAKRSRRGGCHRPGSFYG